MDLISEYNGQKVLITGHTGFKGSWLTLWLSKLGADVYGYSLPADTLPNNYSESAIREVLSGEYMADVRDINSLERAIKEIKPDYIFHLAAQPIVRESYKHPLETFDINVMGSLNLLHCLSYLDEPCSVIMVTSDKCYKNRSQVWGYREIDPMGGSDPYSASKAAMEIAISSYRDSFYPPEKIYNHGIRIASVRAGNVIGGGDWAPDRIVPDSVRAFSKGKPVVVRNPHAVRPWQHVLEPLSGYIKLAAEMYNSDDPGYCSAWNFGPYISDECSVSVLMDMFCKEWGNGIWECGSSEDDPAEASVLRLSIEKAVYKLKWHPVWNLHETVRRTIEYYKKYYSNDYSGCMIDTCYNDINDYMRMMK